MLNYCAEKDSCEIICDNGERAFVYIPLSGRGKFRVEFDTPETFSLEPDTVLLQTIADWCAKADADVTITNNGTFSVFDGTTEKQLEITSAENLIQLLQIMYSYKESLEDFGEWV